MPAQIKKSQITSLIAGKHYVADPHPPLPRPDTRIRMSIAAGDYGAGHAFGRLPEKDNPRLHRRPLYPPADKSLVWNKEEREKMRLSGFRPLILAYNEPRFLFDFHAAGGLLGHLFMGLSAGNGSSKWFHQWLEIQVHYTDGQMQYILKDPVFPGVTIELDAITLAKSIGLIVKLNISGIEKPAKFIWAYGGASAFFTNFNMTAPEFSFSAAQCGKDVILWNEARFELHRSFDKSDLIMVEPFAAPHFLPNWNAIIQGGSSWNSRVGFGAPDAFAVSPAALIRTTDWHSEPKDGKINCVAVAETELTSQHAGGYIVIGMGGDIQRAIRQPVKTWKNADIRNADIASRICVRTPDPYLDAATRMMSFATEGTWGDSTVMHGGWSWRFGYLGWRGWYGMTCSGWTDRIRQSIRNFITLGLIRKGDDAGALHSMLDTPDKSVYYNMNEVFLDHVRHYFDYTNDLELMREIFPVFKGIVGWENRRLQPKNEFLYENALNTWISDSHWYTQGQCTQASAYMLGAHRFLADIARRLGEDYKPFEERAQTINVAMQQKLWLPRAGVFAEYRDTRGHCILHPQPELPTIYHSAEFGAADQFQISQMLRWAETNLRAEKTPGGGKQFWSSNWFPNNGRSYTHSTYEMAYAEELNFALTHYLAGQADDAYALLRSTFCGIFNGPTPGGLACHSRTDGRQRANDEFADAISMWVRTVTEGLFGIIPKLPDGCLQLTPQFPSTWSETSIRTPLFSYKWKRTPGKIKIEWEAPQSISVHLRLPLRAARITVVVVDGKEQPFRVEPGIGFSWLTVETPPGKRGIISCSYTPQNLPIPKEQHVKHGGLFELQIQNTPILAINDPQGILEDQTLANGILKGRIRGTPGPALLFILTGTEFCQAWFPVRLRVEPEIPVPAPKIWSPPDVPGRDLAQWTLIDLTKTYNATILTALAKVHQEALPPPPGASTVGFIYWKDHLFTRHSQQRAPSDAAWRAKVGPDNVAWTTDGIPFRTVKKGNNIGIVTRAGHYPMDIEFPINASGKTLYLMLSGITFPVQSHVVNLRVALTYANGTEDIKDLISSFDIGDCWSTLWGHWHDTAANGFENLGGRFGPAGSSQAQDLTQPVSVDTEAHLAAFDLRPGTILKSVRIEAFANDVIFGVMGASVLK